jgi:Cu-Zn family superoxide dismutase
MRRIVTGLLVMACVGMGCSDEESTGGSDSGVDSGAGGSDAGGMDAGGSGGTDAGAKDAGVVGDAGSASFATAMLAPKSVAATSSTTSGVAAFSVVAGKVSVLINVIGAPPGKHGLHIHEKGDCSADDASSAGGHWNPTMHMHGAPSDGTTTHLGDLGNIEVGTDGKGTLTAANAGWTLGGSAATDVIGKAVVVHAMEDDLTTQQNADAGITPGNSGKRIACGVITAGK